MSLHSEILESALPRSVTKQVASDLHIGERHLYRWRAGEEPSPIDRFLGLLRTIFLNNPAGAEILMGHITLEYQRLCANHLPNKINQELLAAIHKECGEAVQALLEGKPLEILRRELLEARAALDEKLLRLEQESENSLLL